MAALRGRAASCCARRRGQPGPPAIPVFPPYPYRAGHYPTVDDYYDLPPYADINPSFYRGRYFLTLRERYRYRYVPHVFHGSEDAHRHSRGVQGQTGVTDIRFISWCQ